VRRLCYAKFVTCLPVFTTLQSVQEPGGRSVATPAQPAMLAFNATLPFLPFCYSWLDFFTIDNLLRASASGARPHPLRKMHEVQHHVANLYLLSCYVGSECKTSE
jgi:hypothetical protein